MVPIPNVKLTLYKVGSVTFDGNVHFVTDSVLQFTGIDFENLKKKVVIGQEYKVVNP